MLSGEGMSTNILYHSLQKHFEIDTVIIEKKVDRKDFLKKRIRKLGYLKVVGQILFQGVIAGRLKKNSAKRRLEIMQQFALNNATIPANKIKNVDSVNSSEAIGLLQKLQPAIVVVSGTRIISKKVLESIDGKFLNIHAGITPHYRGVHGAYWALVNNDRENCGVTVHLVDAGIDTGEILYQQKITITPKDNFVTYPLLQLAEGIEFLKQAINDIFENKLRPIKTPGKGNLWHHPTFTQYIFQRLVHHIK